MHSAVSPSVFSLPLRHLWNTQFSGDQVVTAQSVKGLSRYVGDSSNSLLRYFAEQQIPEPSDWPIVFHGPTGTGKTSLAMAILDRLLSPATVEMTSTARQQPVFLSAADFVRRFRSAIDTDSVTEFREKMGGGFLIDDLHYLADYAGAQQELCFLIDQVLAKQLPIIFTINQSPGSCLFLSPQLTSRLMTGLSLPVVPPGESARRVVLQDLATIFELKLQPEALDWLVERLNVTVPRMNHVFAQLKSMLMATKEPEVEITADFLVDWFNQLTGKSEHTKIKQINQSVARHFGFKVAELKSQSRKQTLTLARSIAMFLCRDLLDLSFLKIGKLFGNRDHTTVMHSCRKIASLIESEPDSADARSVFKLNQSLVDQFSEFQYGEQK